MSPEQLRHLDFQFDRVHKRLDTQDTALRDQGQRLSRIEGGDAARAAIQMSFAPVEPAPAKRMARWQRITLSVVGWVAAVATTLSGAWEVVKHAMTTAPIAKP